MTDRAEQIVRERLCAHCRTGAPIVDGGHEVRGVVWSGWDACGYTTRSLDGPQVANLLRVAVAEVADETSTVEPRS